MSGWTQYNAACRHSVSGTLGELQVTAAHEHVVVDVQNRNDDTVRRLRCEHALARLPLQTAMRLCDLLDEAIAASAGITTGFPRGATSFDAALLVGDTSPSPYDRWRAVVHDALPIQAGATRGRWIKAILLLAVIRQTGAVRPPCELGSTDLRTHFQDRHEAAPWILVEGSFAQPSAELQSA
jgi:hypothetical protein